MDEGRGNISNEGWMQGGKGCKTEQEVKREARVIGDET